MPADAYTSVPSTGKFKLKGVSDGRINKKKRKKKTKAEAEAAGEEAVTSQHARDSNSTEEQGDFTDRSVVLKNLATENDGDNSNSKKDTRRNRLPPERKFGDEDTLDRNDEIDEMNRHVKTASELRFQDQKRRRLEERLKREGVKTHKQRVEELNRYLSGLSEHHDMPKIGPG